MLSDALPELGKDKFVKKTHVGVYGFVDSIKSNNKRIGPSGFQLLRF